MSRLTTAVFANLAGGLAGLGLLAFAVPTAYADIIINNGLDRSYATNVIADGT